jgi:NDP-sugar pyrophosphorylase family protein
MSRRAVVLAGGQGLRLRPYTVVLPKPLMPIGEFPVLEVIIKQLARQGFGHVTLAVNHQAEIIKAFFGDGAKWGVKVDYSMEGKPLSTMGPLKLIGDLPEDFLVMNGDVLTDLDFAAFFEHHVRSRNLFTVSAHRREQLVDYGVLEVDRTGKLCGFKEKPRLEYEVSMGIYMANRRILEFIPPDRAYGFDHLMLDLIAARQPAAVKSHSGYWLDIGRPDDYATAQELYEFDPDAFLS